MHEPGPPRFTSVGEPVELAPRDPDPEGEYGWTIDARPEGSEAALGSGAVVSFVPDEEGVYRVRLDAPGGSHEQVVRAFPDERRPVEFEVSRGDLSFEEPGAEVSLVSTFNGWRVGETIPERRGDEYVYETGLPPGEYPYGFVVGGEFDPQGRDTLEVPGPGRPQVSLTADLEGDQVAVTAAVSAAPGSDREDADVDVEFYPDGRDDLDRSDLEVADRSLSIPADTIGDRARIHAVAHGERRSVADVVRIERTGSGLDVSKPHDPPAWAQGMTVYEIFVRSFVGGRLDADFGELERRVPYLDWLGVDAVWLTPVLASPTTHGYHVTDYFETAADLGSRGEFESLVETCHDHDIRVIFDLVINHSAAEHPHFEMAAAGHPEYREWYVWDRTDDGKADRYFDWTRIPNFDFRSLDVRAHHLDVIEEWAPLVDGFRADVAWGVPHGFWKEARDRVREIDDEFLMLDETVPNDPLYGEGEFGVHHDTDLYGTLREIGNGEEPATALLDAVSEWAARGFAPGSEPLRYVENHDEDRYLAECGKAALKAATAATFTLPGAPMIYYGQERGVTEYRGEMAWRDGDDELTEFHRRLSELRGESDVLRRGDVRRVEWTAESEEVVAFRREHEGRELLVALHFDTATSEIEVGRDLRPVDLVTGEEVEIDGSDGTTAFEVGSVRVFEIQ